MRVGFGYDIHALSGGRPLILGGVQIPYKKGLYGHSDADVLCHAIIDALLGAAALGDIGEHFPDTDSAFKDASSLMLLEETGKKINQARYKIVNIDATIVAEAPKLLTYRLAMMKKIASSLKLAENTVSIKATTNEGFESVGKEEAIKVFAVVLIEKII